MKALSRPTIPEMLDVKRVAIVGVSAKLGYYWVYSMLQWEHDLDVWLISKSGGKVLGRQIHTDLQQIPGNIDYAIIAVPKKYVASVLKEVSEKGAKGATIFTSGFSELGTAEGRQSEEELSNLVKSLPTRVLGPNCMGLLIPKMGFAFMPTIERGIGNVGFLSQSGGVAISTYTAGVESGLGFSKVFSFGNSIDITPSEIMQFLKDDVETKVVGTYIEGTKEGEALFHAMLDLASRKPVVALKGGRTAEGSRAASSHTGALAGSNEIWHAAFKQTNIPVVRTVEEMVSTLSVFSLCPVPASRNVAVVAISGGTSVIYTDLIVEHGLKAPKTSDSTISELAKLIRDVGTGLGNPIDLAADYYDDATVRKVIQLVGAEKNFDSIILEADVHNMYQVATIMDAQDVLSDYWKAMAETGYAIMTEHKKPVVIAIPEVAYPQARNLAWKAFVKHKLPVMKNITEAVGALSRVCGYYDTQRSRSKE
jgi:acyl-CoA synthetase (NDP forming)